MQCLNSGWSKSKTVKAVYEKGYDGSKSNAFDYLVKAEEREGKTFEPQLYKKAQSKALKYMAGSIGKTEDYITREGVFKHMWMNMDLTEFYRAYIYDKFPDLWEIDSYIKRFRNFFQKRMVTLLYS